jgi:hypothetical protein
VWTDGRRLMLMAEVPDASISKSCHNRASSERTGWTAGKRLHGPGAAGEIALLGPNLQPNMTCISTTRRKCSSHSNRYTAPVIPPINTAYSATMPVELTYLIGPALPLGVASRQSTLVYRHIFGCYLTRTPLLQ